MPVGFLKEAASVAAEGLKGVAEEQPRNRMCRGKYGIALFAAVRALNRSVGSAEKCFGVPAVIDGRERQRSDFTRQRVADRLHIKQ